MTGALASTWSACAPRLVPAIASVQAPAAASVSAAGAGHCVPMKPPIESRRNTIAIPPGGMAWPCPSAVYVRPGPLPFGI